MRRRKFIKIIGGAAVAWPLAMRAQQMATPVVGFLRDATAAGSGFLVEGLRKGLAEAGYVEGRNLIIDFAWTEDQSERLSALAIELVGRHVPVRRFCRSKLRICSLGICGVTGIGTKFCSCRHVRSFDNRPYGIDIPSV
jgi:hypothetical protein